MRRIVFVLLASAAPLLAQQPQGAAASPNAAVAATKGQWQTAQNYLVRSAEQMPEADYSFRPVATVRTFGEIIGHVAGAQYMFCATALGEPARAEDAVEKSAKTKADLVKALKDAGAYCEKAYSISDAMSAGPVSIFGMTLTKMGVLVLNATHDMEHYGNLVTYFRIKGMVPPSSQQ